MATRRDAHQDYLQALTLLGKPLARRAGSRCELSGQRGTLEVVDLFPDQKDPTLDQVVLVCPQVRRHLEGQDLDDETVLRYLQDAVWTIEPAVREAARRILVRLDAPWAREALEHLETMALAQES